MLLQVRLIVAVYCGRLGMEMCLRRAYLGLHPAWGQPVCLTALRTPARLASVELPWSSMLIAALNSQIYSSSE